MNNKQKVVGRVTITTPNGLHIFLPVYPGDTPSGVAKEYQRRWEEKYGKDKKDD